MIFSIYLAPVLSTRPTNARPIGPLNEKDSIATLTYTIIISQFVKTETSVNNMGVLQEFLRRQNILGEQNLEVMVCRLTRVPKRKTKLLIGSKFLYILIFKVIFTVSQPFIAKN